jgi:hypothetical protein
LNQFEITSNQTQDNSDNMLAYSSTKYLNGFGHRYGNKMRNKYRKILKSKNEEIDKKINSVLTQSQIINLKLQRMKRNGYWTTAISHRKIQTATQNTQTIAENDSKINNISEKDYKITQTVLENIN